ncbi:Diacylglycerol kinase [Hondaea fermentalgiana]|uniref:Diacylglycerol kinase n=1 Tax=Hondaea fermentalgiana TaxID=2315210 RepID=A0A2R5GHQ8_9STRA|nr:Diacylglycerol kinase [Hondaea fermentalgiana]|eukprot:GBG30125.1 Diacylglycerol kinase [Hondaea fermentalgiana]
MGCVNSSAAGADRVKEPVAAKALAGQVFVMVNGSSGGNAARALLELGQDTLDFEDNQGRPCRAWFFDFKDADSHKRGMERVTAESTARRKNLRVVAAGGDGTVKWVLSELIRCGLEHLPIGVIPFGTGNDFSRAMGFGASAPVPLVGAHMLALKKLMIATLEAQEASLDVWKVRIAKGPNGKFFEVRNGAITEAYESEDVIEEEMINYFSLGADAQIVFEFEQQRTASQLGNKLVYVERGTHQLMKRPARLRQMIEKLESEEGDSILFRKSDRILAFLNIPSYSAGANVWSPSKRTGRFGPQYVGDGRLEACTIHGTANVAMHIGTGSKLGIKRTAQLGAYNISFCENADVYLQIDGEAVHAQNPATVSIEHGYTVQVLRAAHALARSSAADVRKASFVSLPDSKRIRSLVPGEQAPVHVGFVTSDFQESDEDADNEDDEDSNIVRDIKDQAGDGTDDPASVSSGVVAIPIPSKAEKFSSH